MISFKSQIHTRGAANSYNLTQSTVIRTKFSDSKCVSSLPLEISGFNSLKHGNHGQFELNWSCSQALADKHSVLTLLNSNKSEVLQQFIQSNSQTYISWFKQRCGLRSNSNSNNASQINNEMQWTKFESSLSFNLLTQTGHANLWIAIAFKTKHDSQQKV